LIFFGSLLKQPILFSILDLHMYLSVTEQTRGNPATQSHGTKNLFGFLSAEPPETNSPAAFVFLMTYAPNQNEGGDLAILGNKAPQLKCGKKGYSKADSRMNAGKR